VPTNRRLPAPWSIEEYNDACFDVRDSQLAYVYLRGGARPGAAPKPLTNDKARRIAANVAKLPELVRKD
jgi:hypothetical protein